MNRELMVEHLRKAGIRDEKVLKAIARVPREYFVPEELRKFAKSLGGREQLAVNAFANALEIIPKTLAENAGLDPIDMLVALKAAHAKGMKQAGIDVEKGSGGTEKNKGHYRFYFGFV